MHHIYSLLPPDRLRMTTILYFFKTQRKAMHPCPDVAMREAMPESGSPYQSTDSKHNANVIDQTGNQRPIFSTTAFVIAAILGTVLIFALYGPYTMHIMIGMTIVQEECEHTRNLSF